MPARKQSETASKSSGKSTSKPPTKTSATSSSTPKSAPVKKAAKKAPQSAPYEEGKWAFAFTRAPGERRYWLIKSEPEMFSYDDLVAAPKQTTCWDSIRSTGARNFLRDGMKLGDLAFYYHSNAEPSAIVGICEVVREGYPDTTAIDPKHAYFDPDSDPATPTWFMVDVRAVSKFAHPVSLAELKARPELADMSLIKVSRLSVVPVQPHEWEIVVKMGKG